MLKKTAIILMFIAIFTVALWAVFYMQKKTMVEPAENSVAGGLSSEHENAEELFYTYKKDNLSETCAMDDRIFCAVERVVKCTINPEMNICHKDVVPAFVLGQTEDVDRPSEISFKIAKIKPIPESSDLSVYTQSNCNAIWFGLCKGTVVYSLSANGSDWQVTNIFALE